MSKQYWLCCRSLCPDHKDSRGQKCREAETGHPERCRFGTSEDHGKWDRAQKESAYVGIDRDELKRLQRDAMRYRFLREQSSEAAYNGEPFICIEHHGFSQWNSEQADEKVDSAMFSAKKQSEPISTSNPYQVILTVTGVNKVKAEYTPSFESPRFKINRPDSNYGSEERKAFEARFPFPEGIKWEGEAFGVTTQEGDAFHKHNLAVANRWRGLWEGWKVRALFDKDGKS